MTWGGGVEGQVSSFPLTGPQPPQLPKGQNEYLKAQTLHLSVCASQTGMQLHSHRIKFTGVIKSSTKGTHKSTAS